MVSENRLGSIAQLDRQAALSSGKYSRRIRALARGGKGAQSAAVSGRELRELASKAGAAERSLFLALQRERDRLYRATKTDGAVSLVQPLNLAGVEAARVIRLRTGSLATEVPGLGKAAVCGGDIVTDRLLYRYVRAATAEDDAEVTRALRAIQIQLACMSTRQVRVFEEALVKGVEWAETFAVPTARDWRSRAIRDSFRQLFAPVIFATADASRLFAKHDRPAVKWLTAHKEMLAASALRENTIAYRVGLLFANRFSGKLLRVRGACAPGAKRIFKDGRGGLTCNPLAAFFRSSTLVCDVTQWVPENQSGAGKFVCDDACAGLPGSGTARSAAGARGSRSGCPYAGPQLPGTGGAGNTGGSPGTPGGAGPRTPGSSAGQSCGGADPMYGVITGQRTPAQAYNNAYTACLMSMAGQGHTSLAADAETSGYAPGGGAQCLLTAQGNDDQSEEDEQPKSEEAKQQDANLEWAKKTVNQYIEGFAQFIDSLFGGNGVPDEAIEAAKISVNQAQFGDAGQCDTVPCEGETSADGKSITINRNYCASSGDCFNVLMHEAMHSVFTGSEFDDENLQHGVIGVYAGDIATPFQWWAKATRPQSCPRDEPSCADGCTSREAATPDCTQAGLAAAKQRLDEMQQDAEDCATDACWNPAADDGTRGGQECGNPNACVGQSVALCLDGQADCMCKRGARGLDVGAILRNQLWADYCTKAYDERCSSPTAPVDFGGSSGALPTGPPISPTTRGQAGLIFGGGRIIIRTDGTLTLGRSQQPQTTTADDPDCQSNLCRASQRGDW